MVTDPLPRVARLRKQYEASDARTTLALPDTATLQRLTAELGEALAGGERADVKQTGGKLLGLAGPVLRGQPAPAGGAGRPARSR